MANIQLPHKRLMECYKTAKGEYWVCDCEQDFMGDKHAQLINAYRVKKHPTKKIAKLLYQYVKSNDVVVNSQGLRKIKFKKK